MNSSRLWIGWSAAVLALGGAALAGDAATTRAVSHSEAIEAGRLMRLAADRHPREIPIFGASKAEANYMPEALGPNFYNYGLASASPDVVNWLLAMELQTPNRAPIIIDLVQWPFDDIGDPRNYLPLADRADTRAMLARAGVWRPHYAIPGLRYFGSWDWYAKGFLTDRIAITKRIVRGYVHHLDQPPWDAETFGRDVDRRLAAPPLRFGLHPRQTARLLALMRGAPERRFVIVLSPLHRAFLARISGEADLRDGLVALQAAAPNLSVIDMTRATYPDRYWLNTGHLNETGARAFSGDLRAALINREIIG